MEYYFTNTNNITVRACPSFIDRKVGSQGSHNHRKVGSVEVKIRNTIECLMSLLGKTGASETLKAPKIKKVYKCSVFKG